LCSLPKSLTELAATFFDDRAETDVSGSKLPHWQQQQSTIFITFRLGDSVPASLLNTWQEERRQWIKHHPEPWSPQESEDYHRRFTTRLENWLDQGHGTCLLRDNEPRRILAEAIRGRDGDDYLVHSCVLMPTHVHCLVTIPLSQALPTTVQNWKSISAHRINRHRNKSGKIWQRDYFDRIIRDFDHYERAMNYIRNNPMKAKLSSDQFTHYELPHGHFQ